MTTTIEVFPVYHVEGVGFCTGEAWADENATLSKPPVLTNYAVFIDENDGSEPEQIEFTIEQMEHILKYWQGKRTKSLTPPIPTTAILLPNNNCPKSDVPQEPSHDWDVQEFHITYNGRLWIHAVCYQCKMLFVGTFTSRDVNIQTPEGDDSQ